MVGWGSPGVFVDVCTPLEVRCCQATSLSTNKQKKSRKKKLVSSRILKDDTEEEEERKKKWWRSSLENKLKLCKSSFDCVDGTRVNQMVCFDNSA